MGGRPKRSHWECDDSVVLSLVLESLPNEKRLIHFHAIRQVLNDQVESLYPHAHIRAYGSVPSNLPMPHSDVDLCIVFEDVEENECSKQWRVEVLTLMRTILRRSNETVRGGVEGRFHARVPVVCFNHKPSGLDVDINTMDQGIFKASFMRMMTNLSPLLVPLVRIVKLWAHRSSLNDPTDGTLNSYCLTLLAIFHLQRLIVPQLPPIWQLLPSPASSQQQRPPFAAQASGSGASTAANGTAAQSSGSQSSTDRKGASQTEILNGAPVQQRPHSSHRIMHAMKRPPSNAMNEIQAKASQWRRDCAPPAKQLPLDSVVLAFYVRFSAFLLARYRRYNDTSWRTVSTWAASLFPCKKQKMKFKGVKGNVHKCMGKQNMADDADPVILIKELLRTLQRYWTKSGGAASAYNAALGRVLEASALMISPGSVASLRKEFAPIVEEKDGGAAHDSATNLHNSGPSSSSGATVSWIDSTTRRQARMLDSVYTFLLKVPQSTRGNERAAIDRRHVDVLASSDVSDSEEEINSSEDSNTQGQGYLAAEAANVAPVQTATESVLQSAQDGPPSVQQQIVRNKELEAKENYLILDMSSDDDESAHEASAHGAVEANKPPDGQVQQVHRNAEPGPSSSNHSGAAVFASVAEGKGTGCGVDAARGSEIASAPVCAVVSHSADLPATSALSQELESMRLQHSADSGGHSIQAPADQAASSGMQHPECTDKPAVACGAEGSDFSIKSDNVTGARVRPSDQARVGSAASTQGFQGVRGAPSAPVANPGAEQDHAAIAPQQPILTAAELQRPDLAHFSSESSPEFDSPAERVRELCQSRLAALDCELAVEDPFDECDNAARTLRHFGKLLAHVLLPVLYGTDALECLLRAPPPNPEGKGGQQHLQDSVRQACNIMQKFEYPISPESEEERKIQAQADQWLRQAGPGKVKDRAKNCRQLSDSHMQALRYCKKSNRKFQASIFGQHAQADSQHTQGQGPGAAVPNHNGAAARPGGHRGYDGAHQNGRTREQPQSAGWRNSNEFPTLSRAPGAQPPHPGAQHQHGNAPGLRPVAQPSYQEPQIHRNGLNMPAHRPVPGATQHQHQPQMYQHHGAMQHQPQVRQPLGATQQQTYVHPRPPPTPAFLYSQGFGPPRDPRTRIPHGTKVPVQALFQQQSMPRASPPCKHAPLNQAQHQHKPPPSTAAPQVTAATIDREAAQKAAYAALEDNPPSRTDPPRSTGLGRQTDTAIGREGLAGRKITKGEERTKGGTGGSR